MSRSIKPRGAGDAGEPPSRKRHDSRSTHDLAPVSVKAMPWLNSRAHIAHRVVQQGNFHQEGPSNSAGVTMTLSPYTSTSREKQSNPLHTNSSALSSSGPDNGPSPTRHIGVIVDQEIHRRLETLEEDIRDPYFNRCQQNGVFSREDNTVRALAAMRVAAFRDIGHNSITQHVRQDEACFEKLFEGELSKYDEVPTPDGVGANTQVARGGSFADVKIQPGDGVSGQAQGSNGSTFGVSAEAKGKIRLATSPHRLVLLNTRRQRQPTATESMLQRLSRRLDTEVGSQLQAASVWAQAQEDSLENRADDQSKADEANAELAQSQIHDRKAVWDEHTFASIPQVTLPKQEIDLRHWKEEALRLGGDLLKSTDRALLQTMYTNCDSNEASEEDIATSGRDLIRRERAKRMMIRKDLSRLDEKSGTAKEIFRRGRDAGNSSNEAGSVEWVNNQADELNVNRENEKAKISGVRNEAERDTDQHIHEWCHEYFMRPIGALHSGALFHTDWFVPSIQPVGVDVHAWTRSEESGLVLNEPQTVFSGPGESGRWPLGDSRLFNSHIATSATQKLEALFAGELNNALVQARAIQPEVERFLFHTLEATDLDSLLQNGHSGDDQVPQLLFDENYAMPECAVDGQMRPFPEGWVAAAEEDQQQRTAESIEELERMSTLILQWTRDSCSENHLDQSDEEWVAAHVDIRMSARASDLPPIKAITRLESAFNALDNQGLACASLVLHLIFNDTKRNDEWVVACQKCLLSH